MIRVIFKVILLFFIIFVLQSSFIKLFPPYVDPEVIKVEKMLNQKKDILYFGDSIIFTGGLIPARLEEYLKGPSVGMVAHPADSPSVYLDYCRYLSRLSEKPKIIIIPISMRDFAIYWEDDPGRRFEEEKLHFRFAKTPIEPFVPFLISFKVFKLYPRSLNDFYELPFMYKGKSLGKVSDYYGQKFENYSDENMKKKIILSYEYEILPDDFELDAVDRISNECGFSKIVFYISPVPFETIEKFLGKTFAVQIGKNIDIVKSNLLEKHALILDLSHDVPADGFIWENNFYISEHMTAQGQNDVAVHLTDFIQKNHLLLSQ